LTAINHALTGAIIGLSISQPALALPLALSSHFVCDAIPHFGLNGVASNETWIKSPRFKRMLIIDACACGLLVLTLLLTKPQHWLSACICAFLAASPDFLWINHFLKAKANKPWRPGLLSRFASYIQWFEKPIGGLVELTWFGACVIVLSTYLI
jgi:hypothetical protein